jgi:hypothetical protein
MANAYLFKRPYYLICLLSFSLVVSAQEKVTDTSLLVGSAYVNNIEKVSVNQKSDIDNSIGVNVDKKFLGKNASTAFNGFAKYHSYLKNTFSDQVEAQLSFNQVINNTTKHFFWMTSDALNSVSINPSSSTTPTNTQLRNTLSIGPDYHFQLDNRSQFILSSRYIKNNFQHVGDNNHRISVSGTLNRQISTKLQAGLVLSASKDKFKSGQKSKKKSAGINFNRRILDGSITGNVAVSKVNTESVALSSQDFQSFTWNLGLNRQVTPHISLSSHLFRQLDNTSSQFNIPIDNLNLQYNQLDIVKITGADLTLTDQVNMRSSFQLGVMANKSKYLTSHTQDHFITYTGRYDYKFTKFTSSVNKLAIVNSRYESANTTDKLYKVSSGLLYKGIKGMALSMTGSYERKNSTIDLNAYKTWSLMLNLKYLIN